MKPAYRLTESAPIEVATFPEPQDRQLWATFEVRSVDEEKRIIEGIATTSEEALDGLVLETRGIEFKLPLPFLYAHDISQPLGNVVAAKVGANQIDVRIEIARQGTAEFIDEKWRMIKGGIVRGLSIRWRTLKAQGNRILKSRWLELSAVALGSDLNATVTSVRSADEAILAALGKPETRSAVVRISPPLPGVSGKPLGKSMTTQEQITQWDAKLVSTKEQIDQIMKAAQDGARTLEADEETKIDELDAELEKITKHIDRLRKYEQTIVARATPVTKENTADAAAATETRQGRIISVKRNDPKGIGVARMAIAVLNSKLTNSNPLEIARRRWPDSPEVEMHLRAVVEAGDTTTSGWASQLVPAAQAMNDEFLEMLRALVVMGRIPGMREVDFNVSVPLQSGGGTYGYVGEGAPKPVTRPTYGSATLRFEKAAGIIVITEELARFSRPRAETLVRDELLKGLTAFFDTVFVGAQAAVANVSPAGIRNGISATPASGTTAAKFRYDMNVIIQNMITNNRDPSKLVILMSSGISMSLSSMQNSLSQSEFPTINANGGNYLGIPIVTSQALGTNIILIDPTDILLAEDPAIRIDVSREASVEMSDSPILGDTSPTTGATLKSFWQNNLVGLRAEQFRTWKVARTTAVEYISGAAYTPPAS